MVIVRIVWLCIYVFFYTFFNGIFGRIRRKRREDPRTLMPVRSTLRRQVGRVQRTNGSIENETTPGHVSTSELYSHADTGVASTNFYPLDFIGGVNDVSPFSETYEAMTNIPIATCAAVVMDPDTGKEYLLVFHQMLWFGSSMPISLIQTNQCSAFGVEICDNPTDSSRSLGMQLSEDFLFPFQAKGPTMLFTSRCPTGEEIGRFPHFVGTEDDWDPSGPIFDEVGQYTEEREYTRLVSLVRTVNDVSEGNRVQDLPDQDY